MALIEINRTVETPSLIRDPQGSAKYLDECNMSGLLVGVSNQIWDIFPKVNGGQI